MSREVRSARQVGRQVGRQAGLVECFRALWHGRQGSLQARPPSLPVVGSGHVGILVLWKSLDWGISCLVDFVLRYRPPPRLPRYQHRHGTFLGG